MALKVGVINGKAPSAGIGGVSDADLSNLAVNFLTGGITKTTDLVVAQNGTPNMTVAVAAGVAYVKKADLSNIYVVNIDAASVNVGANSSGNPRIDALVVKVDLAATPSNLADNVATLVFVAGTPAASPAAPDDAAIQASVGAGNAFLRLANVTVANGASSIVTANISDQRVGAQIKLLSGYFKYNISTSKLQFSHDGTAYKDVGAGTATPAFTISGGVAVATDQAPTIIAPFALTIIKAFARVKTAPTGADLIIDINKNGSTIWSTQGNRLTIAATAVSGSQATFNTTALAEGDYLTIDIDQVGSTVQGADLTVELYCQAA